MARRRLAWAGGAILSLLLLVGVAALALLPPGATGSSTGPVAPASTARGATTPAAPAALVVPQSEPLRLVQPDTGLDTSVLELPASRADPIDPPTLADAYWDPAPVPPVVEGQSFGLGTQTPDLTVIAGHTSNKQDDAVFNPFYDWRTQTERLHVGHEVWVQTATSGSNWLVYTLDTVHFPAKDTGPDGLVNSVEVWGTAENPRPNRLLLIGCQQEPQVGRASQRNIVWDFHFTRVDAGDPPPVS